MASQWDDLQGEILDLYLTQNKSLNEVIELISARHGFVKGVRAYREKLKFWGALKTQHQFRDSGYGSNRASTATTPSRPTSSDCSSQGTSLATLHLMHDVPLLAPSSDPVSLNMLDGDESNSTSGTVRNAPFSTDRTRRGFTDRSCHPIQHSKDHLAGQADHVRAGLEDSVHSSRLRSTISPSKSPSVHSASVHAPLSRCDRRQDERYRIKIDVEACDMCGASKPHYLAMIANGMGKQVLFQKLHSDVADVNLVDKDQNTPLHFLASLGPAPGRVQTFERAGANIFSRNRNGDTFLHVLEPSKLGGPHLTELLIWSVMKGVDLKRRNYDGKTFLHCLVERRLRHDDLMNVLTTLQSTPKLLLACDSSQSPLGDCLMARDNRGHTVLDAINANPDPSYRQHVSIFLPAPHLGHLVGYTDTALDRSRPASEIELQEKEGIMRNTVLLSAKDPAAKNPGDDMNALSCLAYIVRLCPEFEVELQSFYAREMELKKCLDYGVDPNDYDCSGSPPLHHFVSTFRRNESDDETGDLIELLIYFGADVNMRNVQGESALHVACQLGRVSCVKKLLLYKANVHAFNHDYEGIVVSAKRWMDGNPGTDARIQECIDLVSRAGSLRRR